MSENLREPRLPEDLQRMQKLADESSIISIQTEGDPPELYRATFKGKGLARVSKYQSAVEEINSHQFEIRLGFRYPETPPEVRWKTSILHPNISYGGFVKLQDIGIKWTREIQLDQICERLWDVVRFAYCDVEHTSNYAAKQWVEDQNEYSLPLDMRVLRDFGLESPEDSGPIQLSADNIVRDDLNENN